MIHEDIKARHKFVRRAQSLPHDKRILTTLLGDLERMAKDAKVDFLEDSVVIGVVKKYIKNAETMIRASELGSVQMAESQIEIMILEHFMPQVLTDLEVEKIMSKWVSESPEGITMGILMGNMKSYYPGRYDGRSVSMIAKAVLA